MSTPAPDDRDDGVVTGKRQHLDNGLVMRRVQRTMISPDNAQPAEPPPRKVSSFAEFHAGAMRKKLEERPCSPTCTCGSEAVRFPDDSADVDHALFFVAATRHPALGDAWIRPLLEAIDRLILPVHVFVRTERDDAETGAAVRDMCWARDIVLSATRHATGLAAMPAYVMVMRKWKKDLADVTPEATPYSAETLIASYILAVLMECTDVDHNGETTLFPGHHGVPSSHERLLRAHARTAIAQHQLLLSPTVSGGSGNSTHTRSVLRRGVRQALDYLHERFPHGLSAEALTRAGGMPASGTTHRGDVLMFTMASTQQVDESATAVQTIAPARWIRRTKQCPSPMTSVVASANSVALMHTRPVGPVLRCERHATGMINANVTREFAHYETLEQFEEHFEQQHRHAYAETVMRMARNVCIHEIIADDQQPIRPFMDVDLDTKANPAAAERPILVVLAAAWLMRFMFACFEGIDVATRMSGAPALRICAAFDTSNPAAAGKISYHVVFTTVTTTLERLRERMTLDAIQAAFSYAKASRNRQTAAEATACERLLFDSAGKCVIDSQVYRRHASLRLVGSFKSSDPVPERACRPVGIVSGAPLDPEAYRTRWYEWSVTLAPSHAPLPQPGPSLLAMPLELASHLRRNGGAAAAQERLASDRVSADTIRAVVFAARLLHRCDLTNVASKDEPTPHTLFRFQRSVDALERSMPCPYGRIHDKDHFSLTLDHASGRLVYRCFSHHCRSGDSTSTRFFDSDVVLATRVAKVERVLARMRVKRAELRHLREVLDREPTPPPPPLVPATAYAPPPDEECDECDDEGVGCE